MKRAERAHADDDDPDHFDRYEALEGEASMVSALAYRIRRAAWRSGKRS